MTIGRQQPTSLDRQDSSRRALELFTDHGAALWSIALVLHADHEEAESVVADLLVDASVDPVVTSRAEMRRILSRRLWLTCMRLRRLRSVPTARHARVSGSAFASLSDHEAPVLALCTLGGHTYLDVADTMSLSTSTVLDLLTSGLLALGEEQPARPAISEDGPSD
ncbi:RNA polymerase sigma factor [Aeromicrobium sp.]|uniref:RNA polymerase sigma factor n=1 Tax=Aeromicrobium sp. TaxID=1871063 RepID=UPI003C3A7247